MIDLAETSQAYDRYEIADKGLVRSNYNLADCMNILYGIEKGFIYRNAHVIRSIIFILIDYP